MSWGRTFECFELAGDPHFGGILDQSTLGKLTALVALVVVSLCAIHAKLMLLTVQQTRALVFSAMDETLSAIG